MRRPFKEQVAEVTAALITDAVTLSAASNATVTGNVTAEVAGNIANVSDMNSGVLRNNN